ncbi:CoA-transferase, partial [Trinickia diaoshuihuensis]|uniref:CoA-transferase n=1 Tax=Trinickia diaoshuihuensis TaxID=2292265 RepID=UPI0030B7FF4E
LMEHVAKGDQHKILEECTLPLTGVGVVNRIITDLGVIDVTPAGLTVMELAPGVSAREIAAKTSAPLDLHAVA